MHSKTNDKSRFIGLLHPFPLDRLFILIARMEKRCAQSNLIQVLLLTEQLGAVTSGNSSAVQLDGNNGSRGINKSDSSGESCRECATPHKTFGERVNLT